MGQIQYIDFTQDKSSRQYIRRVQLRRNRKNKAIKNMTMSSQPKLVYGQDELASVIAMYESYLVNVESNLVSEKEMEEKGDLFLSWVNDLLAAKLTTINHITEKSIEIFKQISIDEVDISARILQLEHECVQKNTAIQNHLYTIKHLETKLTERENDIQKMKHQIIQLTEKIDKQETKFKRQTKEFKKTFAIIQENTESDKQIFDSIQFEYEYEKQQKDMIKDQLDALIEEKAVIVKELQESKRLNRASQNKLQWEIKKKMTLEDVIKEKNQLIDKLLHEIKDLKDTINPYDGMQEDHLEEKDMDDLSQAAKQPVDKNILSEQMALRQSFFSEADLDEDFIRRNSFRKSFDQGPGGNPSDTQFDYPGPSENYPKKSDFIHENNAPIRDNNTRSKKSSFHEDHILLKPEQKSTRNKSAQQSANSIMIRDLEPRSPTISPYERSRSPLKSSPEVNQFDTRGTMRDKEDELQIITQKVQSERQSTEPFRRHVPDLYFAHFLLTSQAVKIKEDCQEMLNIDVKQYYEEIIQKRVPMHVWDDWVRDKLRIAVKDLTAKYEADRRRHTTRTNA